MTESPKQFINRTLRERIATGEVDRVTVVIDESDDSHSMIVGAVLTDDPDAFAKITTDIRRGKEMKYRTAGRTTKEYMENKIAEHGAETLGVYVNKKDLPLWWIFSYGSASRHQKMIMDISEDLIKLNVNFDKIIVDDNDWDLPAQAGSEIVRAYMEGVREFNYIGQEESDSGDYADILQTADFAIGAMGRRVRERGPETPIKFTVRNVGKKNV